MKRGLISVFLLAVGLIGAALWTTRGEAAPVDYRGAYVTSDNLLSRAQRDQNDLIEPATSGVFIRIAWRTLQPGADQFDWAAFDSIAVPAIAAGKKLSVGVIAGSYAPDWLGDQMKIPYAPLRISQRGCMDARFYSPWNKNYQDQYLRMLRGVKSHLQQIGGYDNLTIVKISFIAQHTLELRLPRRTAGDYDGCALSDANTGWSRLGYRPRLVVAGYTRVVDEMARSIFPGKILSQATMRGDSFPDIDDNGQNVGRRAASAPVVNGIIRACIQAAAGRCAIQNQSLQSVGVLGDRVLQAKQSGAIIGWQTAKDGKVARCQIDTGGANANLRRAKHVARVPCTADAYKRVLDRAVAAGATYLELWPGDVKRFASVVRSVDQQLTRQ